MSGLVQLASPVFHLSNFPRRPFSEVVENKIFMLHSTHKHALLQAAASASSAADYSGKIFPTHLKYLDFLGFFLSFSFLIVV